MPMLIRLFPHCEPEPPGIYLLSLFIATVHQSIFKQNVITFIFPPVASFCFVYIAGTDNTSLTYV